MNLLSFIIFAALLVSTPFHENIVLDKEEAQKGFKLLLEIRKNPDNYALPLLYEKGLNVSKILLQWNDTLAKVAEAKAYDMAKRNYFGHMDPDGIGINYFINKSGYLLESKWLEKKDTNYFESLVANVSNGEVAIKELIRDQNTPSLGHRKHLLGLDSWNGSLKDIGIGFCRRDSGSSYSTYVCVIIAKHKW